MVKNDTLEVYRKYLFDNPDKPLPTSTQKRLIRIRVGFTHWCEFPMKSDTQIRDFLISMDISKSMAYYDIEIIKILLGNVKNAGKEWHRYRLIAMVEETFELAKEKKDAKAKDLVMQNK